METKVSVMFHGKILPGITEQEVKRGLAQLYKTSAVMFDGWFCEKPIVIKKNIKPETAEKIRTALHKIGMLCNIEESPVSPVGETVKPPPFSKTNPQRNIHVARDVNDGELGVYSIEQINKMIVQHRLFRTDLAWHEGLTDWVFLREIRGVCFSDATPPPLKKKQRVIMQKKYEGFYCSSDEKLVLGLCAGLAHKYNLPVSTVRLAALVSLFFVVGWLYLAGLVLPKHPTKDV